MTFGISLKLHISSKTFTEHLESGTKYFVKRFFFGIPEYVVLLIVGQNEEKSPAAELRLESNLNPVMYGFLSISDT